MRSNPDADVMRDILGWLYDHGKRNIKGCGEHYIHCLPGGLLTTSWGTRAWEGREWIKSRFER